MVTKVYADSGERLLTEPDGRSVQGSELLAALNRALPVPVAVDGIFGSEARGGV